MAVFTSQIDGYWRDGATWGNSSPGVEGTDYPGDNDAVSIALATTVTFNENMENWANGVTMSIQGTLQIPYDLTDTDNPSINEFYLKLTGTMDGQGSFNVGDSSNVLAAGTSFTFDINGEDVVGNQPSLTFNWYCYTPPEPAIRLSAGVTGTVDDVLPIESLDGTTADLTGYNAGDTIVVCDINKTKEANEVVIESIDEAAQTITLTGAIPQSKSAEAVVCHVTRNIRLISSQSQQYFLRYFDDNVINCEVDLTNCTGSAYRESDNNTIGGSVHGANMAVIDTSYNDTFNGMATNINYFSTTSNNIVLGADAVVAGYNFGYMYSYGGIINGGLYGGNTGVYRSTVKIGGTARMKGNSNAVWRAGIFSVGDGAKISNNTDAFDEVCDNMYLYNVELSGNSTNFNNCNNGDADYIQSWHQNQITDNFKAHTRGGETNDDTTEVPTNYNLSYKHSIDDTTYNSYCFRQIDYTIPPGETLRVEGVIKLDDDFTGIEAPKIEIVDKYNDPLINTSNSALASDSVTSLDNTSDWQDIALSYKNTDTHNPIEVYVRCLGKCGGSALAFFENFTTYLYNPYYFITREIIEQVS